jgi:rod shape-determining protein MreD
MRLAIFYILLIVFQGLLAALFAPLPPPDLFLLAVLTLLWRLPPWQLVLVAYGVGLVQDMIGFGTLGLHGLGLAGAVLAASFVRAQFNQADLLERLLVIASALLGKWLVFTFMLLWLSGGGEPFGQVLRVMPLEALFTLVVGLWLLPYAEILMERSRILQKELL